MSLFRIIGAAVDLVVTQTSRLKLTFEENFKSLRKFEILAFAVK